MNTTPIIHQLKIGPMDNIIHIIECPQTKHCILTDPAWDITPLLETIQKRNLKPEKVLLTHGHPDHINAVPDLLKVLPLPIYLHPNEHPTYQAMLPKTLPLEENQTITCGTLTIQVLYTPGHSPGSVCFLIQNHLIVGDCLFIDGCGHTRLLGADASQLYHSIQRLKSLPDNIIIYPGHDYGPTTTDTIDNQKQTNPYMLEATEESFIHRRTS